MTEVEKFAGTAREFVDWCLAQPSDPAGEARSALALLGKLYFQAQSLPSPKDIHDDLDGERPDQASWDAVFQRARALPFGYYSCVFDPHVVPPEEPVIGDIADDIADIYRDLSEGLSLHDQGHVAEAAWVFVDTFRIHWGRHAVGAMGALHCWFAGTGNW